MKEKDKITRLISKIIAGQATPEEEKYVQHYFGKSRPHTEWDSASMGDKDEVRENLKGKLIHQLQNRKIEPPKFRKLYSVFKVATVAAAILIVCLTGLHINSREKAKNDSIIVMENIIVPGSDKGSLTLSNGSKIDLEKIGAGESIHQEGMSVSKNMAGEINYSFINKSENGITINDPLTMNTLVTPLGGRLTIELADGTKVWLNSGSKLVFPNEFSAKLREVTVVGEAYFKVAENEKQPFIVHTNKTQIKVLGTEFNVNAYSNEKQNITTLIEGSIQMQSAGMTKAVSPGQKVVINQNSDLMSVMKADIESITAWKENNFVFKNQNIKMIMNEISKWYDVEVEYIGNMDNKFFDVFVSRRKNIEEILAIIELTESVHFKIEGRRVLVIE